MRWTSKLHSLDIVYVLALAAAACTGSAKAQAGLPDAPKLLLLGQVGPGSSANDASQTGGGASELTLKAAEDLAVKNNPRISVQRLLALAQHQVVRQARAADLPTATANMTAEDGDEASRISAGSLTASRIFEHAGAGVSGSQLITDFGRTHHLIVSSKLQEKAQNAATMATAQDVTLATDEAFYQALQAQALLEVAKQNLATRQTTADQISALTKNKLKSTLDLSFADVNLSQAKLMLLDADSGAQSAMAALDEVLGLDNPTVYRLVAPTGPEVAPPADDKELLALALEQRPDLQSASLTQQSAAKYARAERDQLLPTVSALGTAGTVPIRPGAEYYVNNWWGAVGVNVSIPIFNGFLYQAQAKAADLHAQADAEQTRELRDSVVKQVRTAWLSSENAYRKLAVTAQTLEQANLALRLAQTRYQMGLSNIVELTQAQYQQTDASIADTDARYQYLLSRANLSYTIGDSTMGATR